MLLTGEPVEAAQALRMGLVHRVVPREQLLEESRALLAKVLAAGPLAVRATLEATGLPADRLHLELTESALLASADAVRPVLDALKTLGVQLCQDDFGTGYSSLTYLRAFPIVVLKLDRSFVAALGERREDFVIVQAIVQLARGLGLKVVAEGVESEAQRALLSTLQCDYAQGYLFGRPLDPQAAQALIGASR